MKYILLTGATGFLGSHLLKTLLKTKHYRVLVIKRSFSDTWRICDELKSKFVHYINIDTEYDKLITYFNNKQILAIIHCATCYGRDGDCSKTLETNLIFPVRLLELAVNNEVSLFINTDSYFNKDSMSYKYLQNYSLSKKSLLLWLKFFSKKIKIVNMILEHVYGDSDNENKFVASMINKIAIEKTDFVDCTHGDQKRDFIFIDDVCNAYMKVLEYGLKNKFRYKSFDIGLGNCVSIKDFVSKIKELSKSTTKINFGAIPYRSDEIMMSEADNIDLLNIGWKPKYDYIKGIETTIKRSMNEIINHSNTNI